MSALAAPPVVRPLPDRRVRHLRAVGDRERATAGRPPAGPTAPGMATRPTRVRLTRRGRLAVLLVLTALLVVVGMSLRSPADAARGADGTRGTGGTVSTAVTVRPGESLWQIAVRAAPDADPRTTVHRIREMNGLRSATILAGQRLLVPMVR